MADPRLTDQYDEINAETITAIVDASTIVYDATKIGGSASVGLAVKLSASSTVALTSDASPVYGKLKQVEWDNYCTVQVEGYMKLPGGLSATLTPGAKVVGATGASAVRGYVRAVDATALGEVAVAHGMIVDNTDTTNCVVCL